MIELIFTGLSKVLSFLLTPIDNLLLEYIPSLATLISYISNFLNYILSYIIWALSWFPFDFIVIDIAIDILIVYFTITALMRPVNLLLNWIKEVRT